MSDNYNLKNVSSMGKHSHKWQDEAMKSEIHDLKTWIMYVKQLDKYNRKYQRLDFVFVQFHKTKTPQTKLDINLGVSSSCKCLEIGCLFAFRWVFIVFKCVVVTVVAVMTGWERTVWTVA